MVGKLRTFICHFRDHGSYREIDIELDAKGEAEWAKEFPDDRLELKKTQDG